MGASANTARARFCQLGRLEGLSFLVLLFVAMPLKYLGDMPMPTKVVGWAHGVLFVAYGVAALIVARRERWRFGRLVLAGVAAFLPFGPFVFERRLLPAETEAGQRAG
jgi:integral membrane protein